MHSLQLFQLPSYFTIFRPHFLLFIYHFLEDWTKLFLPLVEFDVIQKLFRPPTHVLLPIVEKLFQESKLLQLLLVQVYIALFSVNLRINVYAIESRHVIICWIFQKDKTAGLLDCIFCHICILQDLFHEEVPILGGKHLAILNIRCFIKYLFPINQTCQRIDFDLLLLFFR